MFNRWPVRYQVRLGTLLLLIVVLLLASVSYLGVMKFHTVSKSIRHRAHELPYAARLSSEISDLRKMNAEILSSGSNRNRQSLIVSSGPSLLEARLTSYRQMEAVRKAFQDYRSQLVAQPMSDSRISDISAELELSKKIAKCLDWIEDTEASSAWIMDTEGVASIREAKLDELQNLAEQLPHLFQQRMEMFAVSARSDYRALYMYNLIIVLVALLVIVFLFAAASHRIFRPLEKLIRGSRRVAEGDYGHRIEMKSGGEIELLARALNEMTANFQAIKNDLDEQVRQRTKEVIRSEQMASVGFMAAGLAHEINNPLAAIAWSAESLESRFLDLLQRERDELDEEDDEPQVIDIQRQKDIDVICKYLRRIQDEAFRCKNITSGLLDYSRLDDKKKQPVELVELVQSVVEMVRPLQKYSGRQIHFNPKSAIHGLVNAQEMKQVVLNLVTNALESIPRGGNVWIDLSGAGQNVVLNIRDDGCGLSPEVREHLFEPFFTRRSDGSGTGLGLAITYRIIEEHQGTIVASSAGENQGATFTVQLPLVSNEQEEVKRIAA